MGRELQEVVDKEQHHQEQTVKALKDIHTSSLAMEYSHRKVEAAYNRDRWGKEVQEVQGCRRPRRCRACWWEGMYIGCRDVGLYSEHLVGVV